MTNGTALDILTPAGKVTKEQELHAYVIFQRYHPGYTIKHTDKDKPEPFDGWLMQDGKVRALVETKCRADVDYHECVRRYKNTWLITEAKIKYAADCARRERVPLLGFLYIVRGQVLLVKKLTDKNGAVIEHRTEKTKTRATVNGGLAERLNAFIDMTGCEPMQMLGHIA